MLDKIILYTIHCTHCRELELLLKQKNIEYETVTDMDVMESKGFMQAPMLEVNGEVMNHETAKKWVQQQKG